MKKKNGNKNTNLSDMDSALLELINSERKIQSKCGICNKKFKDKEITMELLLENNTVDRLCLNCGTWFERIRVYIRDSQKHFSPKAREAFERYLKEVNASEKE